MRSPSPEPSAKHVPGTCVPGHPLPDLETIVSKSLAAIIAAHEAYCVAQITQEPAPAALTPKGDATRTVYALRRQMAALEPAERRDVLLLVCELLAD